MTTQHDLKTWPVPFQAICDGTKTYEIRQDDRHFAVGDTLHLQEWDPQIKQYTGRGLMATVTHLTAGGKWGLPWDICVMAIKVLG